MVNLILHTAVVLIIAIMIALAILNLLRSLKESIESMDRVRSVSFKFSLTQKIFFWGVVGVIGVSTLVIVITSIYSLVTFLIK